MNKGQYSEKNGRGFYAAVALAVIALVAATVGAGLTAGKTHKAQVETSQTSIDWDNHSSLVETEANITESGVKDERTTENVTQQESTDTTNTTEETTAEEKKTVSCSLPLSAEILKDYSDGTMVKSKTMNDWRTHNGVDFTGETGDEICAVCGGTVKETVTDQSWGTVIVIEHENGLTARYCGIEEA